MMNWNWQDEWAVMKSSIPEWESFIFSNELFWPLHFGKDVVYRGDIKPRLSSGRLLIAIFFLEYFQKNNDEIETIIQNDMKAMNSLLIQWKSNWTKKILAEIPLRLKQWQEIIQQIRRNSLHAQEYSYQVHIRLMLELMILEIPDEIPDHINNQIIQLDQLLINLSQQASFVWNDAVVSAFNQDQFWYLFRKIIKN